MAKYEEEVCRGCKNSHFIENRTHWLCKACNHIRLHGETQFETQIKKKKQKPVKAYKLKQKPLKRSKIKPKKKKQTGEWNLFLEIWGEREHICENCKLPLGGTPLPIYFSHIKSKGAYPELRLVKSNIELLCPKCHSIYEFGDREEFKKRKNLHI